MGRQVENEKPQAFMKAFMERTQKYDPKSLIFKQQRQTEKSPKSKGRQKSTNVEVYKPGRQEDHEQTKGLKGR